MKYTIKEIESEDELEFLAPIRAGSLNGNRVSGNAGLRILRRN